MSDDLIYWLRVLAGCAEQILEADEADLVGQAADRIEELEAKVKRLSAERTRLHDVLDEAVDTFDIAYFVWGHGLRWTAESGWTEDGAS